MNFMQYIPYTSEYKLSYGMAFVKQIFSERSFEIERYVHYKNFKNKLINKSFSSGRECSDLANKIQPGLGESEVIRTIEIALNLE